MDSNITELIEEFMESALAQWVQLFEEMAEREDSVALYSPYMEVNSVSQSARARYARLTNGIFLNKVMRVIDPHPKVERLYETDRDDHALRVQNFSILNRHIRAFYQEDMQQLILMPLPNVAILGQDPLTEAAVEELRRLLLLLLGCAVQCERKETFIQQIQSLDIETQAAIAGCIQQVTQDPRAVVPLQWEELVESEGLDLQLVFNSMTKQIQNLLAQRDSFLERMAELCREQEGQADSPTALQISHGQEPPQGLALQLADSKAKVRRLKQQLEDKDDQVLDSKQEIQTMEEQLRKLQKENRSLQAESRGMRALRDELDCARERAARAEQLQNELQSCKNRLRSLELTRTQLKEQQQLCAALQETKALLEEQLADARARCSSLRELERDNLLLRQRIIDVEAERDVERQRADELLEVNVTLETDLRHCGSMPAAVHQSFLPPEPDFEEELRELIDQKPLSVEVGKASMLRLLGAEQENAELKRLLEELQAQQEVDSPDTKDELLSLEIKHQDTLREFENLKNENTTLTRRLEQLLSETSSPLGKRGEDGEEEVKGERGVQGTESCRGEGEGKVRVMEERRREIIGSLREAGVGEEVLHARGVVGETCQKVVASHRRGEAEGGQKDREKQDNGVTTCSKPPETLQNNTAIAAADQAASCPRTPDVELLTKRFQEAQEEADRQAQAAQDLRSKLADQSKRTWEAEQRLVVLEAEHQHLKKAAESLADARRQIEVLQSEGLVVEEELCRLRSQAELHRMQTTVIATLEGERAALERDRDTLRSSVDGMRTAQRKGDQLELTVQTLRSELERQGRSLESSRRREEELEAELREATLEAESLARARDQALLEASRLEQEKEACQSELDGQRKEGRQREREAGRLRQQLESTTLALEHSNQRTCTQDSEHRVVCQQLSESMELCARLQDLEKELRGKLKSTEEGRQLLQEQCTDARASINTLSQDLSSECTRSQELSAEVQRLRESLQAAEAELVATSASLSQSRDRADSLSRLLHQRRTENGGDRAGADVSVRQPLSRESSCVGQTPEAGGGRDSPVTEEGDAGEAERQLRERLMALEKEKAAVVAEREALLSKLSQAQEESEHLKEQLEALRRHSLSLQESCTSLQTLNTQLQVEQASQNSQHAAVLARCSESEARRAALEAESKVWAREREESTARMEALRRDHERMAAVQQRQEAELEELLDKHSQLRSSNRSLEAQHRELETRYKELLDGEAQLKEREREMDRQRQEMEAEAQRRLESERELEKLKDDSDRLQAQQKEWLALQAELLAQGSVLKGELSASQLERTRLEGELSGLRETNQSLDLSNARLTSQYQLLSQLKGNMEEENRHLMGQNQTLLKENQALLEQSLVRCDQHYSQQQEYQEKLSELRREKQKLVEKIMDQYRVLDPSMHPPANKAKKTNRFADKMKKLIKPRVGGGKEGRAIFTAAGSVENLADGAEFTSDCHAANPVCPQQVLQVVQRIPQKCPADLDPIQPSSTKFPSSNTVQNITLPPLACLLPIVHPATNPRSAPGSPVPGRKVDPDISVPGILATRPGSGGRRKLGSRHGWGLGLARGGSGLSQSFSPGDHKTPALLRLRSAQNTQGVVWEGDGLVGDMPRAADGPLESSFDEGEDDQNSNDALQQPKTEPQSPVH